MLAGPGLFLVHCYPHTAHAQNGAVTLALLFGLFALIYGVSQITMGVELRRTGKTLNSVREDVTA
jgi:uncharacterized membrane protein HdeD (DUF308 family)